MNKRQMKKNAKRNSGRKVVEYSEGLKLEPVKDVYLEEDVTFGEEEVESYVKTFEEGKGKQSGDPLTSIYLGEKVVELNNPEMTAKLINKSTEEKLKISKDREFVDLELKTESIKSSYENARKHEEQIKAAHQAIKDHEKWLAIQSQKDLNEIIDAKAKHFIVGENGELDLKEGTLNFREKEVANLGDEQEGKAYVSGSNKLRMDGSLVSDIEERRMSIEPEDDKDQLEIYLNKEKPKGFINKIKNFFRKG